MRTRPLGQPHVERGRVDAGGFTLGHLLCFRAPDASEDGVGGGFIQRHAFQACRDFVGRLQRCAQRQVDAGAIGPLIDSRQQIARQAPPEDEGEREGHRAATQSRAAMIDRPLQQAVILGSEAIEPAVENSEERPCQGRQRPKGQTSPETQ